MKKLNFQRVGAKSNAQVGRSFEKVAFNYFLGQADDLTENYSIAIGFNKKKNHRFDLGGTLDNGKRFVVECKSHKWTSGNNVPSAKLTVWNEAMLYFSLLPDGIEKYFFVLKDYSEKRGETLAQYYVRTYGHLIPSGVVLIEYDEDLQVANILETV